MQDNLQTNRTLLLVDDEDNVLSALTRLFHTDGYTILCANSARQGIELLKEHNVDVILSDQRMPEMTGVEFLMEVKQAYPDTIRIILSGYIDLKVIMDAINNGAIYKLVTKPWDVEILQQHIVEAFEYYEIKAENIRLTEELKQINSSLEKSNNTLKKYDVLTGLPNRTIFKEKISQTIKTAIKDQRTIALLLIDIDRFKNINESLGHTIGDKLLKKVADRLREIVSESDTIARLGGDEFGILLTEVNSKSSITNFLEKIQSVLEKQYTVDSYELYATVSIGVCLFPDNGDTADVLLKHADTAMYQAKERGKNAFQYYSNGMSHLSQKQLKLEVAMRKAIENNEFILHYQPQIELKSYKIRSVEALIRWNNPDEGLIPPDDFIPFLEETGMIIPVGKWVISEAMKEFKEFINHDCGPDLISINISSKQFLSKDLIDDIMSAIDESGLSTSNIELEITETLLMKNIDEAIDILLRLKKLGIKVAVDDFGTGYSSLNYLKRLPINVLKLDRSFVKDLDIDKDSAAIASAIISLGHELGMEIIAEGVETDNQLKFLAEKKCDIIQGYLFSKPLPSLDIKTYQNMYTQHKFIKQVDKYE